MSDELKVGDVVVLRSGGPRMTLVGPVHDGVPSDPQVRCMWFCEDDLGREPREIVVSPAAIRKSQR